MHCHRLTISRSTGRWLAWACVVAQFLLWTATIWHHHDDAAPHHDCTVCLAAAVDKSDGLPPPALASVPAAIVGVIYLTPWPDPAVDVPRHGLARGPPEV